MHFSVCCLVFMLLQLIMKFWSLFTSVCLLSNLLLFAFGFPKLCKWLQQFVFSRQNASMLPLDLLTWYVLILGCLPSTIAFRSGEQRAFTAFFLLFSVLSSLQYYIDLLKLIDTCFSWLCCTLHCSLVQIVCNGYVPLIAGRSWRRQF